MGQPDRSLLIAPAQRLCCSPGVSPAVAGTRPTHAPPPPTPPWHPPPRAQDHGLASGLDVHLIPHCRPALVEKGEEPEPVYVEMAVQNVHRAVGTTLSYEVTKRFGEKVGRARVAAM
jgi:hypothetical protein